MIAIGNTVIPIQIQIGSLLKLPVAPTGLTLSVISDTQINLSWTDNSDNEDSFDVYRSTNGTDFTLVHQTAANATSWNNTGLTGGALYYYKVCATNAAGSSDFTTTENAQTWAWYGVEWDVTNNSPDVTRIGSDMTLHASLPVQSLLKGVVLNADRTVNYYLKADDWSKKADGSASTLTGADGNVMVRKDAATYWLFETDGNVRRAKCSIHPISGFTAHAIWNLGAYQATLVSSKLSSHAGVLATTSRSETQFRIDARANGSGWEQNWYTPAKEMRWMFVVEYATLNWQKAVNGTLTAQGYKQGGLGDGVTTANGTEWGNFNNYTPFITNGASNSLANGSGEVSATIVNFGGAGINRTFKVPRYRGIENPFGHIWEWVDGVTINHGASQRDVYVFDNPANFADNTSTGGTLVGQLPAAGTGWMTTAIFGSTGCFLPSGIGGSSTTKYCDYFYSPSLNVGWRALLCGGAAYGGADAGAFGAYTNGGAASAYLDVGARLSAS